MAELVAAGMPTWSVMVSAEATPPGPRKKVIKAAYKRKRFIDLPPCVYRLQYLRNVLARLPVKLKLSTSGILPPLPRTLNPGHRGWPVPPSPISDDDGSSSAAFLTGLVHGEEAFALRTSPFKYPANTRAMTPRVTTNPDPISFSSSKTTSVGPKEVINLYAVFQIINGRCKAQLR